MGRKLYLSLALFLFTAAASFAQTGEIRGKVLDAATKEPVPFATVTAELNGTVVSGAQTDIDGSYSIKPLTPGKYNVKASIVGSNSQEISGVVVSAENTAYANFNLGKGVELEAVEVISYKVPLIDKGNTTTQTTVTAEEIQNAPTRDVNSIASQSAGIVDVGGGLNIRGSRSDATAYYVDGIKMSGSYTPPQGGTEQITTITGGLPAQYGDATGGVISVTTKGPSRKFTGGIEMATSKYLDPYENSLVSVNLSGPIIMKRDTAGRKSSPLAGFFFAGDYTHRKDGAPRGQGTYIVNPTLLASLEEHPLIKSPTGTGFIQRANYVTMADLEHLDYHPNTTGDGVNLNGKIDIAPSSNINVTLGGQFQYGIGRDFTYIYQLFNTAKNSESMGRNYRMYARLTQKFGNTGSGEKASSTIKNAYYSLQFDYTNEYGESRSQDHGENFFNYGYVGKFTTYRTPFYLPTDTAHVNGNQVSAMIMAGIADTLVTYEPSDINRVMANWTSDYYRLAPGQSAVVNGEFVNYYRTITDIQQQGGLINGFNNATMSVYSLWASPGRQPSGFSKSNNQQYRVTAQGSADIGKHSIILGMEYEQRVNRAWAVGTSGLWNIMRNLQNFNNQQLDFSNPHPVFDGPYFQDTINYDLLYTPTLIDGQQAKGFFENVRDKLGIPYNQKIDIDSYSPTTFNLNMFSPDELLLNGLVSYYGYDYLGNKTSDNPSLSNFLNNKGADNNYTRNIGAFQPNYIAGYIQDKFSFDDLNFNIGLRVDRYDNNQKVLKDKYLLYSAHTAGELASGNLGIKTAVPGNVPSSAVVYVNDASNPTKVVGYRNEDQFYDANGNQISDYSLISQSPVTTNGTIQPYLVNYDDFKNKIVREEVFTDYTPEINYMPRIAFSFPISDEALFYAHYDLLTQRPAGSQSSPVSYLSGNFESANPALQAQRTTDYELGFKQRLTKSSALSIAAFYKELRDLIQVIQIYGAFPNNYLTFGNSDFGTVKGLSLSFDLRRTGNVRLTANYTLTFADGTGSNAGSQINVVAAGIPNLRILQPLDFDQRNTFVTSVDYRYGSGRDYNGPIWWGKQVFSNAGLNLVFRAGSGTPFTRQANITADVIDGLSERTTLEGSINGSNLPWTYYLDAKVDKDFVLKVGPEREGGQRKQLSFNVYLRVLNVLDTRNVIGVYRATGNPDDNGYLSAAQSQASIANQVYPASFVDLYSIKVNNPFNYSAPRRFSFGVIVNFN